MVNLACATGCTFQCVFRLGRQDGATSRFALYLCTLGAQIRHLLPCKFSGLIGKMLWMNWLAGLAPVDERTRL